jgi:hypothetical protein
MAMTSTTAHLSVYKGLLKSVVCGAFINLVVPAVHAAGAAAASSPFSSVVPVPEPTSILLGLSGVGAMLCLGRIFRR